MRRAFTVVELLVVAAVLGVLAALLIPALARAQEESRQAGCTENVHALGMALANLRMDHDDEWNLGGCTHVDYNCESLAIALADGYIESAGTLLCPELETPAPREPHLFGTEATKDWPQKCHIPYPDGPDVNWWGLEETAYFFDEFRVDPLSVPERAILADGVEMCTKYGPEPANHPDGSNVLFVDLAVQWSPRERPDERWLKEDGEYGVGGPGHSGGAVKGPWVRYGYIGNPRMSEDGLATDLDDIYECEGEPPPSAGEGTAFGVPEQMDPDVADEFYSFSKCRRCDRKQHWGRASKTDCAVAGGLILTWWDCWRGMGERSNGKTDQTWYAGEGAGYDGLTWGVPEPFEGQIW